MGDIVTVVFAESGPLGLSLGSTESGPTVLRFPTPGSLDAAKKKFKQEKLESGLVLSTVQGESVAHLHSEQRLKAIKNAGRPLTLGFLRIEGAESTKKGMTKVTNQDTDEDVKMVNPLHGHEDHASRRSHQSRLGDLTMTKFENPMSDEPIEVVSATGLKLDTDELADRGGTAKGRAFVQARFSDLGGVRKIFTTFKTAQYVVIEDISLAVIYRMIQLIVLIYAVMMCMYWHESGSNR